MGLTENHLLNDEGSAWDYSIQYEYPSDNTKGMPKRTAYLYLKELKE